MEFSAASGGSNSERLSRMWKEIQLLSDEWSWIIQEGVMKEQNVQHLHVKEFCQGLNSHLHER